MAKVYTKSLTIAIPSLFQQLVVIFAKKKNGYSSYMKLKKMIVY